VLGFILAIDRSLVFEGRNAGGRIGRQKMSGTVFDRGTGLA
jgi:hypothetical protein